MFGYERDWLDTAPEGAVASFDESTRNSAEALGVKSVMMTALKPASS